MFSKIIKPITAVIIAFIFPVIADDDDSSGISAHYLRVDAPTSPIMGWQEIEVMCEGENHALKCVEASPSPTRLENGWNWNCGQVLTLPEEFLPPEPL